MLFYLTNILLLWLYNVCVAGGEAMSVYIDLLIGINIIVDYFLLLLTFKITSCQIKNKRVIISSVVGGFFSLYIFVPINSTLLDFAAKLISSAIMVLIAVGFRNIKAFLRNIGVLLISSFIFTGAMLATWSMFKLNSIIVNNSTVYFDISPILLIGFSGVFYLILVTAKSLLKKRALIAKRCRVILEFNGKKSEFIGIFDTGNSVKDLFSDSAVIFISKAEIIKFLNDKPENFNKNYRLLPCGTVTGSKLLEAVRIDIASVILDEDRIVLHKPILAISKIPIDKEYSLILNPEILNCSEGRYDKAQNAKSIV